MKRIAAFGAMALALAACGGGHEEPAPLQVTDANTIEVEVAMVSSLVPVAGAVSARQRAEISTRLMARVSAVPVEVGDRVPQGRTLVRLGLDDIAANRARAAAAVEAAQAGRDEAARHAARMDTLLKADAVASVQRDQAYLMLAQAESQLALAEAAAAEVRTAEGYATIVAPFAGTVVSRYVDQGDLAHPGMPLLVIESGGDREAVLAVPADLAQELAIGDTIMVAAQDGRATRAAVRAVAGGADPRSRTVEVRAVLPPDWPTGMSVTGQVPEGSHEAVVIPDSLVVRRGQLTGVRVVTDGRVTLRWVRLGQTVSGGRIEVLSGLEAGDRVAA